MVNQVGSEENQGGYRPSIKTQQEFARMIIVESKLNEIESEVKTLTLRRIPWLQIAGLVLVVLIPSLGFGFQNLLQLQIISERQVQYQRSSDTALAEYKRQVADLVAEDKIIENRLNVLERALDRNKK